MCAYAVLALMTLYNPPNGTVVIVPKSELTARNYTKADIEKAQRCCRSRGIVCRVAEDK